MSNKSLYLTAAVALAMAVPALSASGQTTQRFTANKASEYALVYTLPITSFDIVVETQHSVRTPGEFSNYANRHLGVTDAIKTPSATVDVKSITIVPRGVPDADNRWQAQFKSGAQTSMILTDAGIPLGINIEEATETAAPVLPVAQPAQPTPLETDAARQAMTLDITRSTSQSKKAELCAQRIFELREQRNELISGNAENMPPDGSALQVALDNLSAQEAALTAMFAGTTQTYTTVSTVAFTPGENDSTGVVIARISPVDGVTAINDLSGIPLTLDMQVVSRGELPVTDKGEEKKFPKGGVAYTIPGTAKLTVSFNGRELTSQTFPVAQLGATFGLDPALFTDKKAPSFVEFSPVTGAIVRLDAVE